MVKKMLIKLAYHEKLIIILLEKRMPFVRTIKGVQTGTMECAPAMRSGSGVFREKNQGNTENISPRLLFCAGAVSIGFSVITSLGFRENKRFFEQSPLSLVEPADGGMNALSTSLRERIREHGLFAKRFIY